MKKLLYFILLFIGINDLVKAQAPSLLKDINTTLTNGSSSPNSFATLGTTLYFSAVNNLGGELWKTDGTAAGTVLVKDINPGTAWGGVSDLITYNGAIYFSANNGINGQELWKTDGTTEGTVMVKDIKPGSGNSNPGWFCIVNNVLFFVATEGADAKLWKTDGTAAGTVMIGGNSGFAPRGLKAFGNILLYSANTVDSSQPYQNTEFYKSDANTASFVKEINGGLGSSNPGGFFDTGNGYALFSAYDGSKGAEPIKTDGTSGGTVVLKDINVLTYTLGGQTLTRDSGPAFFTNFNGYTYFSATNQRYNGRELWRTNGTEAGTTLFKDLNVVDTLASSNPGYLTVLGSYLYFTATDGGSNNGLWRTDGTTNGTVFITTLSPSSTFFLFNNNLYFTQSDATNGNELWKTNGTAGGTVLVKDINPGTASSSIDKFFIHNGVLYFRATDGVNGIELWKTDGTAGGTVMVKDIYNDSNSSYPASFTTVGGQSFFVADDGVNGQELWKTDGTNAGTALVKDIRAGINPSSVSNLYNFNNTLVFSANDNINGTEIWKSDGTATGTTMLKDFNLSGNASPSQFKLYNSKLYFSANDGVNGTELGQSDGTANGTITLKDINTGNSGSFPQNFTISNNILFFTASNSTNGSELWKTDGTSTGTEMVKDINTNTGVGSQISNLIDLNGTLFFQATDNTNGSELWKSNGTSQGTVMVKNINPVSSSTPSGLTLLNNVIYFSAFDNVNGTELWRSDGTETGTFMLKDINTTTSTASSSPSSFVVCNNTLFFIANDGVSGQELWKTDGSPNGTVLVKDLNAATTSSTISNLTAVGNTLYFIAKNSSGIVKLWKSDGTTSGTVEVSNPSSITELLPTSLTAFGTKLLIVGNDAVSGTEPFILSTSAVSLPTITSHPTSVTTCPSSATSFSVTATDATSYQWQVSVNNGSFTNLTNTSPYSGITSPTLNISNTTGLNGNQYRCVATNTQGSVNSNPATLTVSSPPNATSVSVNNTSICNGTSVTLSASCTTGTITWYNLLTGGVAIGTGTGFVQTPSTNITYYAACSSNGCESATRQATNQVTVTQGPNNPTAVSVSITSVCSGTSVILSATCATGTVTWYGQLTGGSILGTGTGLSQTPTSNTTYYAACRLNNCENTTRQATNQVTVTQAPNNPTAVSVNNTNICTGTSVTLSATCASGTVTWYNQLVGGVALGTGTGFSQTPTSNTTYYAACRLNNCENATRQATSPIIVTLIPANPTAVSVNNTNICNGSSVTLSATCNIGTVTWYNQLTGGGILGTGTGLSQSPTTTATYYAACRSNNCESPTRQATNQVVVTQVPANPTAVSVNNSNICNGSSISLFATCATGTVTWYNQLTGGVALGTGSGLSQTPTTTTTFYAACRLNNCENATRQATSQVVVTQIPTNPTAVSVSSTAVCRGASVTLSATCATGTVTWYSQLTGGSILGTGTGLSQTPLSNTTYYATCRLNNCESPTRQNTSQVVVTLIPANPTAVSVSSTSICSGTNVTLSATCATGTVTWYNQSTGGTILGTSSGFTQAPSANTTYYAACRLNNCENTSRQTTGLITVTQTPSNPTGVSVNNSNICNGTSVTLSATCATGTVTWYNQLTGGTAIGTGTNLSQSPTVNTTYYAACRLNSCENTIRQSTGQVVVTSRPNNPTAVSVNNTSVCNGTSVILSATCATGTVTWYNQLTGGSILGTGTGLSQSPTSNTIYYAACNLNNCENLTRQATNQVTVTQVPSNPTAVSVNNTTICSGTSVTLSATCATGTVTWYNQLTGGSILGTGTGLTQSPTSNVTYYAACRLNNCENATRQATTQVSVTQVPNVPTALAANPTTLSLGNNTILSATCANGTVKWYGQLSGGTLLGTGSSFDYTPPIQGGFNYYATCDNGTCASTRVASPLVTVNGAVANPTSVSVNNTNICVGTQLSLTANCATGTVQWYNQATGGSSIGNGSPFNTTPSAGNITYYASCLDDVVESGRVPTSSVQVTPTPSSPTSVNISQTSICTGTDVNLTASCATGTVVWYNQLSGGSMIGTGSSLLISPTVGTYTYYAACESGICVSSRVSTTTLTVNETPTSATNISVNDYSVCSGTNVTLSATCTSGVITWYNSETGSAIGTGNGLSVTPPVGNNIYYVSCKTLTCESSKTATSPITVSPTPSNPTGVSVSATAICDDANITLNATCSSGNVVWYTQATGGTAIGNGDGLVQSPNVGTTTYYAACETPNCNSARVATNAVTVTALPNIPTTVTVSETEICNGTNITLSATCSTGTLKWYNQSSGGTAIGTGNNLQQTPTVSTTYYASCENGQCLSARVATNQVVVNNIPSNPTSVNANPTSITLGNSTILSANCASGSLVWYNDLTGENQIGIGNNLSITPQIPGAFQYYAACESNNCVSSRIASPSVNVIGLVDNPTNVSVNNTNICNGDNISLSATCVSGSVRWYNQATGGVIIGTNSPLSQTPSVGTTIYYASCFDNNIESGRVPTSPVTVTSLPINPANVLVSNTSICEGSSVSLTANCSIGTLTWYSQATGGTALGNGSPFAHTPDANITYYASCENICGVSGRVATSAVNVTLTPAVPTNVAINDNIICVGTSVDLTANCSSGVITWYNQLTGGTAIGTSSPLAQSPAVGSYTYYVSCENGSCKSERVATSILTVEALPSSPTNVVSNLSNVNVGTSISLSANCNSGSIVWYNQATGGTQIGTGNSLSYSPQSAGSFQYYAACETANCKSTRIATGTVNVNGQLGNPTNVLVDNTVICSGSSISLSATCSVGTVTWYNQQAGGSTIGTGNPLTLIPSVGNITYYASCIDNNIESGRVATSPITVNAQPISPSNVSANNTAICNGESVSLSATCSIGTITWYDVATGGVAIGNGNSLSQTPSVSTTYYAACETENCNSGRVATSQIVVTNIPNTPSNVSENLAICSGTSTTLSATCEGSTVMWYTSLEGGIGTANSPFNTPTLTNNTNYYVACESGSCKSTRTQITISINTNQPITASNGGPYNGGQTIELSVSEGVSYSWVGPNNFSSTIANPTIPNVTLINGGIYTVTVVTGICNFVATATTNVIVNGVDPCTQIVDLQFVKAGNPHQPLFSLIDGMSIQQIAEPVSVLAIPICQTTPIESVEMTIVGPQQNWTILQNVEPFALFDNYGSDIWGRNFLPGTYTITITGYAQDNRLGGIVYGPVVTTFTIEGNLATISAPTLSTNILCAGSSVNVNFSTTGSFNPSNNFQVQLSDANGGFNNPVTIGTTNIAGMITCQIPQTTNEGTNYRLRVISTNQALASNPSLNSFSISPASKTITGNLTGTLIEQASQTITASNKIISPANVNYQAGKAIILNAGFEANSGTVFKAEIRSCN
ncbi:hypothetical protein GCM10011514_53270 [Emticicia aquatilis]|uniref:Ig-like domain-containing protein n=1 Tax=Emticicia aquatilis TaxID=1537369 RepID=A0A917DYL6_9BACT|nr:ELWxxDGT repeat protein [Emticicia aquatilis]GGD82557.1 hypothetical protein GCM10011514_53270 [Emticicia aquatilis]